MAVIKAFKSICPTKDMAAEVAALPYDVYNREEACEAVRGKKYSFLRIDRAETQFGPEVSTYDDRVYEKARELLCKMIEEGICVKSDKKCYYIYELTMDGRVQTGIVACAGIDDYLNNVIKKHENTREEKELDRIRHVDTCNAQTGPIFLAYRENKVIREIIDRVKQTEPIFSFTSEDEIRHVGYVIDDDSDIQAIEKEFSGIGEIYIADGHHRAASAVKVGLKRRNEKPDYDGTEEFNYFLSVLFQEQELMIMPYNRVVKDLNGLSEEEFISKLKEKFEVEKLTCQKSGDSKGKKPENSAYKNSADNDDKKSSKPDTESLQPKEKSCIAMYLSGQWYMLKAKREILSKDAVEGLDVSLLQDNVLAPILGIDDPRTDKRIDFIGGIRGLKELEKRCSEDMTVAFAMYPTPITELFDVADAGKLMPPKSTWFEPKLRSGLFIHEL